MHEAVATTTAGTVRGRRLGDVLRFAGIPYGSAGGTQRFRPPQPAIPWSGVRDATEFGPAALQLVRPGREPDIGRMDEECLVVNVWTPQTTGRRPVLFWIHGGGFGQGAGRNEINDGARVAATEDVVVVSINHRLGLLGYLGLEYLAPDEFAGSGIAGMLDVVLALEWVRDNIAGFGGDPDNVTVFGHSGGGGKVATLLAMPAARGLFQRAAVHGGPPFGYRTPEQAAETAERLLAVLGLSAADAPAVRAVAAERLIEAQAELGVGRFPGANGMLFAPVVGTEHLPVHPADALAAGAGRGIGLMAGTAVDEADYALFAHPEWLEPGFDISEEDLRGRVAQSVEAPSAADGLVDRYRDRGRARNIDLLREIMSDQFLVRTRRLAEAKHAGDGEPVYLYGCDAGHGKPIGAFHGVQMPFFFDTVQAAAKRFPIPASTRNLELAAAARHAHASFARDGIPQLGEDHWPPLHEEGRPHYVFGASGSRVAADPYSERHALWDGVVVTSRVDPWARLFA